MHAPTTVSFFVMKRLSHWINVPGVGPAGTRTMTFTVGTKPPRGKRGIRRVQKRWYKNLMTWWDDERKVDDDKIAHPADCSQWQRIDEKHKEFSDDPRNVRFGLSTDGMNPFNKRMSDHNTWPVMLTMYNIPTWLCQKRKYLLLTILISGPKQPGIDIDVFLEPLMEEMERL